MSVPHRKFLFVVFHDDECIGKHVVWYAEDLTARGHTVRIILEGQGTRLLIHPSVGPEIQRLTSTGLIAGVCKTGSAAMGCIGCCGGEKGEPGAVPQLHKKASEIGAQLLSDMNGHAGISSFIDQGYELVTF